MYQILKFAFGYRAPSLTSQLSFLQFTTPLIIVAASSWAYHWRVVQEEAPHTIQSLPGIRRRYNYLVSALGLLALTIGLGSLHWWRDQLSAFIAAALVGLVVWLPHWRRIAQIVRDREPEEVTALSRRIYLFMILFVAVLAILFNGAQALNGLLRLVLGETASRRFLSSLFTNIGNVTVVGLFLFY
ncbi:MAG: hypothetical protein HW403_1245, partial [Dehalococcoidia bacterium]|nr:hypothetical protein [Dehalococcoidia bacterium]